MNVLAGMLYATPFSGTYQRKRFPDAVLSNLNNGVTRNALQGREISRLGGKTYRAWGFGCFSTW